jgi:hypothetical protein
MTRAGIATATVGLACCLSGYVSAAPVGVMLPAVSASDVKIRLDGQPKEFPGSWNALETVISGKKQPASFAQGAIAYDDVSLYVAMRLEDNALVRTAAAGPSEDHATLSLAIPIKAGQYRTYQIDLYPGQPGKLPGVVKVGGSKVSGSELVEAPDGEGYTFEARIPWAALPETAKLRVAMRAALRYTDFVAMGKPGSVLATSPAQEGAALPRLLTDPEYALFTGLLRQKGIGAEPSREVFGNVGGDAANEAVALYEKYLVIVGSRFREGKEFILTELQVSSAKAVQRLELADFDGDGIDEILAVYRVGSQSEYREVLQVMKTKPDQSLEQVFAHEVGQKSGAGELHNEIRLKRNGTKTRIEIAQGSSEGYAQDSYAEPKPSDMEAVLLPWEPVKECAFEADGREYKKVSETKQKPGASKGTSAKKVAHRADADDGEGSRASLPPPPRPPSAEEMLDQVYALYRKDRHVKVKPPRFDFVTDVAADGTNERVLVHDKDIVCFGKRFRDGASYVYTSIGVTSPDDIIDMTAQDLTGDGKAEILVRAVVHSKWSQEAKPAKDAKPSKAERASKTGKDASGETVDRFIFLVFQIKEDGIKRIFGAETGRAVEGHTLLSGLRFVEGSRGFSIETVPGRGHGFTKNSYPFPEDATPAGGYEPMPLPWGSQGTKRYVFDGTKYSGG